MKVCSIEDCNRKFYCRDLCVVHYKRWLRHGDPLKGPKVRCEVKDCSSPHYIRGWCIKHYNRWKEHGDVNTTLNEHHGQRGTRLYQIWIMMRARCNNPKDHSGYADYGGRGITICPEWGKFTVFYEWATANGYSDDLTIDRIDNDGNYEPGNCRWANWVEQANNKRNNRFIVINNEKKTLSQWCNQFEFPYGRAIARLNRGWSPERTFGLTGKDTD